MPRDPVGIKSTALEIGDLRDELARLAKRGRVLVLLDACRSGAATLDGRGTAVDATLLRQALAMANVTVLTSSAAGGELARGCELAERRLHRGASRGARQRPTATATAWSA